MAHYTFLPWMRTGMASRIKEKDTLGNTPAADAEVERAALNVELILEDTSVSDGSKTESEIEKKIKLVGPGDIQGINPKAIVRVEPRAHINNFEPNSLAYIEFYEEDFLWRYTPASPGNATVASRRLRPWITLIVLKDGEFTLSQNPDGLSTIKINDEVADDVFHRHTEHWAWGHVHLNFETNNSSGDPLITEVTAALKSNPDSGLSRLMCPRKLVKTTSYTAFVVPTFETGRLAGLGEDTAGIKAQAASWNKGNMPHSATRPNEFPVYYLWNFETGAFGDFESLVSLLKPVITGPESGSRPMAINDPGFGLKDTLPETMVLGLEGALKPPGFEAAQFPNGNNDENYVEHLKDLLNLSKDIKTKNQTTALSNNPFTNTSVYDDPIVTPPIYGQWHALVERLANTVNPKWLGELNVDPRNRSVAGLGTKVIQKNQESYMHRAWKQIGEVNEANQKIREAELAKMVSVSLFAKHLGQQNKDGFISATAHLQKLVLQDNIGEQKTIKNHIANSRMPLAASSPAFKRLTRPGKKSNKKLNQNGPANVKLHLGVMSNFNKVDENQAPTSAKLKVEPNAALDISNVETAINSAIQEYANNDASQAKENFIKIIEENNSNSGNTNLVKNQLKVRNNALTVSAAIKQIILKLINNIDKYEKTDDGFIDVTITKLTYEEIYGTSSNLKPSRNGVVRIRKKVPEGTQIKAEASVTIAELTTFNNFFSDFKTNTSGNLVLPTLNTAFNNSNINNIQQSLKQKINPRFTLEKRVIRNIKIWNGVSMVNLEKLKPIMAHPEIGDPMYEQLSKISQDFIIPNVEQLENNSMTLLETNQKFIESFMAGLNHEMARELLWREYPTDQRGSYFRQFWDVKDNLFEENKENKLDIKKMHQWKKALGKHTPRPGNSEYLVLVVRGELFKKYPNTMVYAHKAKYGNPKKTKPRELSNGFSAANIKFPVFQAELEPDINLFGFELDVETARGHRGDDDPGLITGPMNPGWFFVFKERPGQIRFGLDDFVDDEANDDVMPEGDPETWNDLSWEHFVNNKNQLNNYQIRVSKTINITDPPPGEPDPSWGNNAADIASILYQNPVLFGRHAGEMLPE